jgi:hypothetical protein
LAAVLTRSHELAMQMEQCNELKRNIYWTKFEIWPFFSWAPCSRLDCLYLISVLLSLDSRQRPIDGRIRRRVCAFSATVRSQFGGPRLHTLPQMSSLLCSLAHFTYSVFHRSAGSHGVCRDPLCIFTVDNLLFPKFCFSHLQLTKFFVPFRYIRISLWIFSVRLQMCGVWMWDVGEGRTEWPYLRIHLTSIEIIKKYLSFCSGM